MDAFSLFKFLHVASAVIWVGGGFSLVIIGVAADRAADKAGFVRIIQAVIYLTPRMLIPSSIAVLVFGTIAAFTTWGFQSLWVDLGLIGWVVSFCTGLFLLKPRAEQIAEVVAGEGASDRAMAVGRELLQLAKFDYVILFVIIADMVFKPAFADWLVLVVMVIAIVAGAFFFLLPVLRPSRPAVAA